MSATETPIASAHHRLKRDAEEATSLGSIGAAGWFEVGVLRGRDNVWLAISAEGSTIAHVRLGPDAGVISDVRLWPRGAADCVCEFGTPIGPVRVKVSFHGTSTMRCVTSILPAEDVRLTEWPRDVFVAESGNVRVHTAQRGLRSGIVFASTSDPTPFSVFYFQNFSALSAFYSATHRTPADSVAGVGPELGYRPPVGDDCVLPKAREIVVSDALIAFVPEAPQDEGRIAALYLDSLADMIALIEKPAVRYHDWPERAQRTMRGLALSPLCSYVRNGRRYLMPYVADETKPPESMVQFTVAVNASEYDRWRNRKSVLASTLTESVPSFFDEGIGSIVRWLPGVPFDETQADDNMNSEAMDSWYLHHSLFNVFRIAADGDDSAKEYFRRSLPYVMRVAHRFEYRWPIFFNLRTLDVIRAEAKPGEGGETDVAGLYALVMIHAHEMFGDAVYLREARIALASLRGLGFDLAYQLNTTGFAAEAALRLWKMTREREYLELSDVCLANLFDNMWMWQCEYENAAHYRTFFGLFPLRDAPYLAPYEELEAHAKFHEYLALGGDDLRPSVRFLLAEYQKYALDRCWSYYPDTMPADALAQKVRNGRVVRELSLPIEDLQDGRERSGQVGQEIYGSGLAFVMTSRHYMSLGESGLVAYCDYPMYGFESGDGRAAWLIGGDPRGECTLRIMPGHAETAPHTIRVTVTENGTSHAIAGSISPEGHALFSVRGAQTLEIAFAPAGEPSRSDIVIGAMCAGGGR